MDSDDGLQLNLAGFDVPVQKDERRLKPNRHTVSFKKQQKVPYSLLTLVCSTRPILTGFRHGVEAKTCATTRATFNGNSTT